MLMKKLLNRQQRRANAQKGNKAAWLRRTFGLVREMEQRAFLLGRDMIIMAAFDLPSPITPTEGETK